MRRERDDPQPQFQPVHVRQLAARLSLFTGEDGSIVLPDLILWPLQLNEGELLTLSQEEPAAVRYRFEPYGRLLRTVADWGSSQHWGSIEERLRLPMAAIGSRGKLLLPEEAAPLAQPGTELLLSAPPPGGEGFILMPAGGHRLSSRLFLEVAYTLPLEEGVQVRLPEELLWASGLQEGDQLARKISLGQADFEPFAHVLSLGERALVQLGAGGSLRVPDSFLRDLERGWRILLTATFNPQPAFRLNYDVEST